MGKVMDHPAEFKPWSTPEHILAHRLTKH